MFHHRRRNVTKSGGPVTSGTLMLLCGKHNSPRKVFSVFLNSSRRGESIAIFNFLFGVPKNFAESGWALVHSPPPPCSYAYVFHLCLLTRRCLFKLEKKMVFRNNLRPYTSILHWKQRDHSTFSYIPRQSAKYPKIGTFCPSTSQALRNWLFLTVLTGQIWPNRSDLWEIANYCTL